MKNRFKNVCLVVALCLCLACILASCGFLGGDNSGDDAPQGYRIIFVGTSLEPVYVLDGQINMPTNPTSEGYFFGGWYVDQALTIPFNQAYLDEHPITADLRLYPKWVEKATGAYQITLDVNGGNPILETTIEIYKEITTPQQLPIPTRAGYDFIGWFASLTGNDAVTGADGSLVDYRGSATTFYAKWAEAKYSLVLKSNDISAGKVSGAGGEFGYGQKVIVVATSLDSTNYNFIGWFNGDDLVSDALTCEVTITDDLTLTAVWEGKPRYIRFYNNHLESDVSYYDYNYAYGADVNYVPAMRVGHSFIGWYNNRAGVGSPVNLDGNFESCKLANGIELFACWSEGTEPLNYEIIDANAVKVTGITDNAGAIIHIPHSYEGRAVTAIGEGAFENLTKNAIVIPSSVKSIEQDAFKNVNAKIYFDRGADLSLLTASRFDSALDIYAHVTIDATNALVDDKYVEAEGILADTHANTIMEAQALFGYLWLYTYTKSFDITFEAGAYTGNNEGFNYDYISSVFSGVGQRLSLKSETKNYSVSVYSTERRVSITFNANTTNPLASATTDNVRQTQSVSVNLLPTGSVHSFKIDELADYVVYNSEQLVYAVENGYKPVFGEKNTHAESIYNKARTVLGQIISPEMNEFEKLTAIHDWIALNVTYDTDLLNLSQANPAGAVSHYRGFYLEGVFEDGKAVCDGISKSFMLMARIEGIEVIRVSGTMQGIGHAWNKVKINGVWYMVDVTNDDTIMTLTGMGKSF
ncbi:MAG: InlB B-repeat-containing protein, partial [Clostridia bacterium]|nr:InlB B-repeat-containing protein [Clostridia bacterium]